MYLVGENYDVHEDAVGHVHVVFPTPRLKLHIKSSRMCLFAIVCH